MINRTCVYIVNEHPTYLKMALNSFQMLRIYNQEIQVICYFIRDLAKLTIERHHVTKPENLNSDHIITFLKQCSELQIQVRERLPLCLLEEPDFFHINRKYFEEIECDSVFYIDVDTFIFGDVAKIFERYSEFDFVACEAKWVEGRTEWKREYFPFRPFSSGLMLWNRRHIKKWCENLPYYTKALKEFKLPVSQFLYAMHKDCLLREEFSVSQHLLENNLKFHYFHQEDCHLILNESDFREVGKSLIFHCYTPNWKRVFGLISGRKPKKIRPKKLSPKAFGKFHNKVR